MAYQPLNLPKKYQTKLDFYDSVFKSSPGATSDFWVSWKPQLTKQLQYNALKESESSGGAPPLMDEGWADFLGAFKQNREQAFSDFLGGNKTALEENSALWDVSGTGFPSFPMAPLPEPKWPMQFLLQDENRRTEGFF